MTYNRMERPADRVATLVAVGALHAAAFYAVITGLSVTFVRSDDPPQFRATNTPIDPPDRAEPALRHKHLDRVNTTVTIPLPTPVPTVLPPVDEWGHDFGPGPREGSREGGLGETDVLQPQPTPSTMPPRAARPLGRPGDWVTEADYPTSSIRLGHAGVVGFTLAISASGRATGCEITRSSGFAELDALTCTLLLRRGRFQSATDDQGAATAGRYASAVRWQIPD